MNQASKCHYMDVSVHHHRRERFSRLGCRRKLGPCDVSDFLLVLREITITLAMLFSTSSSSNLEATRGDHPGRSSRGPFNERKQTRNDFNLTVKRIADDAFSTSAVLTTHPSSDTDYHPRPTPSSFVCSEQSTENAAQTKGHSDPPSPQPTDLSRRTCPEIDRGAR